jgi:hypothetical protein
MRPLGFDTAGDGKGAGEGIEGEEVESDGVEGPCAVHLYCARGREGPLRTCDEVVNGATKGLGQRGGGGGLQPVL